MSRPVAGAGAMTIRFQPDGRVMRRPTWRKYDVDLADALDRATAALRTPTPEMLMAGRARCMKDMLGPHMGPDIEAIWRVMGAIALTEIEGKHD